MPAVFEWHNRVGDHSDMSDDESDYDMEVPRADRPHLIRELAGLDTDSDLSDDVPDLVENFSEVPQLTDGTYYSTNRSAYYPTYSTYYPTPNLIHLLSTFNNIPRHQQELIQSDQATWRRVSYIDMPGLVEESPMEDLRRRTLAVLGGARQSTTNS